MMFVAATLRPLKRVAQVWKFGQRHALCCAWPQPAVQERLKCAQRLGWLLLPSRRIHGNH